MSTEGRPNATKARDAAKQRREQVTGKKSKNNLAAENLEKEQENAV